MAWAEGGQRADCALLRCYCKRLWHSSVTPASSRPDDSAVVPSFTSSYCRIAIGSRHILLYCAPCSLDHRPAKRPDRRAVSDHVMSWQVTVNVVIKPTSPREETRLDPDLAHVPADLRHKARALSLQNSVPADFLANIVTVAQMVIFSYERHDLAERIGGYARQL